MTSRVVSSCYREYERSGLLAEIDRLIDCQHQFAVAFDAQGNATLSAPPVDSPIQPVAAA